MNRRSLINKLNGSIHMEFNSDVFCLEIYYRVDGEPDMFFGNVYVSMAIIEDRSVCNQLVERDVNDMWQYYGGIGEIPWRKPTDNH